MIRFLLQTVMMFKLIFILLISLCAAETETLADPYLADQLIITPHFKDQLIGVNLLLETYLIDKASFELTKYS